MSITTDRTLSMNSKNRFIVFWRATDDVALFFSCRCIIHQQMFYIKISHYNKDSEFNRGSKLATAPLQSELCHPDVIWMSYTKIVWVELNRNLSEHISIDAEYRKTIAELQRIF